MGNSTGAKILMVQLFSNGDCLYATTIARQIKHDFSGCTLTWAIADFCKDIIACNPYVDETLIVSSVPKNDNTAFRKFKRKVRKEKRDGLWDEVFITTNMDNNQALYDGTIRGMILRSYPGKINVPVQPILELRNSEINRVEEFVVKNNLKDFKHLILWEFSPQSGQASLSFDFVLRTAAEIVRYPSTCVILSSGNSFFSTETIIDASVLTVRENAKLSHFCNLLIGCSSGITWACTSSAGSKISMIQILNPLTPFINAPSVDFDRYGIKDFPLIEITELTEDKLVNCIKAIFESDFQRAKLLYNDSLPLQFNTTRIVVYNMLCYLQFRAVYRHFKVIKSIYGLHPEFVKQFTLAIFLSPFKLIKNLIRKI